MCKILIAEDELIERMVLKKTLHKRFPECEILDAENGREALRIFGENQIDVAILDIEMPGIRGIEAAEQMRKEKKDVCIIFLTAYDRFEYARKAVSVRAMEYLLKPYSEREIVTVLDEAMKLCEERAALLYKENSIDDIEGYGEESVLEQLRTEENAEVPVNRLSTLLTMIEEYIKTNYMYDISMQEAARAVNYSEPYFCKIFKQQYGQSFTAYLTEYRIEEAKKLLLQPTVNVKTVGERVGYSDPTYFARVFRRNMGVSPTEYRNTFLKSIS